MNSVKTDDRRTALAPTRLTTCAAVFWAEPLEFFQQKQQENQLSWSLNILLYPPAAVPPAMSSGQRDINRRTRPHNSAVLKTENKYRMGLTSKSPEYLPVSFISFWSWTYCGNYKQPPFHRASFLHQSVEGYWQVNKLSNARTSLAVRFDGSEWTKGQWQQRGEMSPWAGMSHASHRNWRGVSWPKGIFLI